MRNWRQHRPFQNPSDGSPPAQEQTPAINSDSMRRHYTKQEKKPLRDETPTDIESAELQQIRRSFGTVLQHLGFSRSLSYNEILERDWDSSFASSFAIDVRKRFMSDIHMHFEYVYNTFLDENSPSRTDVSMQNEAIAQLSKFSESLEELLQQRNNAAQQQPELLASLRQTWEQVLRSGELPGREKLQNFPANAILHLFALGLVVQDQKENLKNRVYEEPFYSINTLKTARFVLEGLGKEMLSAEYIESIARQCMADTSIWKNVSYLIKYENKPPDWQLALENSRRGNDQWGYVHGEQIGFPLERGSNYSDEGYRELCTKYDCRTGAPKRDDRYPNGHPVGDLCGKDPRIMIAEDDYYYTRALEEGEGRTFAKIIIDKYHEEIKASHGDDDKKLDAIVHCCQDLFQAHLLRDGNTRIIAGFILPKLLLENGLRPAIITEKEAKLFAMFSFAEAKQFVIERQAAFDELTKVIRRSDMDSRQHGEVSPKTDGQKIDITRQNYRRSERHRDQQVTFLHNQIKEDIKAIHTIMYDIRDLKNSLSVLPASDQLSNRLVIDQLEKKYTDLMLYEYPTFNQDDGSIPKMVRDVTEGYGRRAPEYPGYIGNPFSKLTPGHKARNRAEYELYKASVEIKELRTKLEAFRSERQRKLNDKKEFFHNKIKEDIKVIDTIMGHIRDFNTVLPALEQQEQYRARIPMYQSEYANLTSRHTSVLRPGEPGSTTQIVQAVTEDAAFNLDIASSEVSRLRTELEKIDPLVNSCIELYTNIERNKQIEQIQQNAVPELSERARTAYKQLEGLNLKANHGNLSEEDNSDFIKKFEELLNEVSPEIMQEYKRCKVEFVIKPTDRNSRPNNLRIEIKQKNAETLQVELPVPCPFGMNSLGVCTLETILRVCHRQEKEVSEEFRAEMTALVYLGNHRLGPYALPCQHYEQAERYDREFKVGITKAFEERRIDTSTPKEELIDIGHKYASAQLLESIKTARTRLLEAARNQRLDKFLALIKSYNGNIPLYLNMKPGSHFLEQQYGGGVWQLNEGQEAVELGSQEGKALIRKAVQRRKQGDNCVIIITIEPENIRAMIQLLYPLETDKVKSHHGVSSNGNMVIWAGEFDPGEAVESADSGTSTFTDSQRDNHPNSAIGQTADVGQSTSSEFSLSRLGDRSGHNRSYILNDPGLSIRYALAILEEKYKFNTTKTLLELELLDKSKSILSYKNYMPRTLADPQDEKLNTGERQLVNDWLRGTRTAQDTKELLERWGVPEKFLRIWGGVSE